MASTRFDPKITGISRSERSDNDSGRLCMLIVYSVELHEHIYMMI